MQGPCQKHNKGEVLILQLQNLILQLKVAVLERELNFWAVGEKNHTVVLHVYSEMDAVPET